jgi:hypothetical protein
VKNPTFQIAPYPLEVPPALLALAPDTAVTALTHWFDVAIEETTNAGQLKSEIEQRIKDQTAGLFTIDEAACIAADAIGLNRIYRKKTRQVIWKAIDDGALVPLCDKHRAPLPLPLAGTDKSLALMRTDELADVFEAWPLNSEPQPAPATTDTNKTKRQDGLSTPDIAVLFDNAPYPSHQWGRRTSDRKWLESARLAMGAQGGAPAMWCPLTLGQMVWKNYPDSQNKLKRTFQQNPALDPWRDEWDQFVDQFSDDD